MYLQALDKYQVSSQDAVMIGDQLMTDILGARRTGIDAILLRPLATREFFGTKFNRAIEHIIRPFLFKMVEVNDTETPKQSSAMKQFVRFCAVGGVSFAIDAALTYVLMKQVHMGNGLLSESLGQRLIDMSPSIAHFAKTPINAAAPILGGVASFIAMFNSFILNRKWTFEAAGNHPTLTQIHRFYTVAILGAILNAILFGVFLNLIGEHHNGALLQAKVIATIFVAFWNFFGQRYYTFRVHLSDKLA
jgi:putative flippase GtrA